MAKLEQSMVALLKAAETGKSSSLLQSFVAFLSSHLRKGNKKRKRTKYDYSVGPKKVNFRTQGTLHG